MGESEAKKKWRKERSTFVACRLNNDTDAAIIRKLKEVPSAAGYIREALQEKLDRESQK